MNPDKLDTAVTPGWPKPGDLMRFLGRNGYDMELRAAFDTFQVGGIYTVKECRVGGFDHRIQFKEVAGWYNGVMFEVAAPSPLAASLPSTGAGMVRGRVNETINPRHFEILGEAMAEVKATSDGLSDQPIADIVAGCIEEIAALEPVAVEAEPEPEKPVSPIEEIEEASCHYCGDEKYNPHRCRSGGDHDWRYTGRKLHVHEAVPLYTAPLAVDQAMRVALEALINDVQEWVDAVDRGTSWDYWDHHYKHLAYGGLDKYRALLNPKEGSESDAG